MSLWRNDIKCEYMFMFPLKNLACQGLILTGTNFNTALCDQVILLWNSLIDYRVIKSCQKSMFAAWLLMIRDPRQWSRRERAFYAHWGMRHYFQVLSDIWARFLSLAGNKLSLCSANHMVGYFSDLACDWLSIVWAYSEQEIQNGPWDDVRWNRKLYHTPQEA